MRKTLNSVFRIRTRINNDNIKKYVKYYIENKDKLPWDLKNKQIGEWDVHEVTDMSELFAGREDFNEPLNDWNVSNVTNMNKMFMNCKNFNQPLNGWDVSKVTNIEGMFERCRRMRTQNKPIFLINRTATDFRRNRVAVDTRQIHKEAEKINYKRLNTLLSEKTDTIIPSEINYPNYINKTITGLIDGDRDEEEYIIQKQKIGLQKILTSRLLNMNYDDLNVDVRESIFYSLNYVTKQPLIFQKIYVSSFIDDCVKAHEGVDGMTCVLGAVERIVFSLVPACRAFEENTDYQQIIKIVMIKKLITDSILDWYKLHHKDKSNAFPAEKTLDDKKTDLREYLQNLYPGNETLINEKIVEIADEMGYDDYVFAYEGGRRRTKKRRQRIEKRRKTIKRKTIKRKTMNKRKTIKRKTNKKK
jgi:surface protein